MKKFLVVLLALSAVTCSQKEDTAAREKWRPRRIQPRLTQPVEWQPCRAVELKGAEVVQKFNCGTPHNTPLSVSPEGEACDDMTEITHSEALEALSSPQPCYSKAIRNLERLASTDPRLLSDLSAAYLVRAQAHDDATALLPAFEHAQKAVEHTPRSSVARFNLALAQEALGLDEDAIQSWDLVRAMNEGGWSTEAAEHREALATKQRNAAIVQWPTAQAQLAKVNLSDRATIARIVGSYPSAVQKYVEEELLPKWDLPRAKAIGEALWRHNGDRYVLDAVAAAERAGEGLREAHEDFAAAGRAFNALDASGARRQYLEALNQFERAQSPFALKGRCVLAFRDPAADVEEILRTATARSYKQLVRDVLNVRAYRSIDQNPLTALDHYARLRDWCISIGDRSSLAGVSRNYADLLYASGSITEAWHESVRSRRYAQSALLPNSLQAVYAVSANIAAELGYPLVAVRYNERTLAELRAGMAAKAESFDARLSIALRARAAYEAQLKRLDAAQHNIDAALNLATTSPDEVTRRSLRVRAQEIAGQIALTRNNVPAAIAAFTEVIDAGGDEYAAFRINTLARRAEAYRRANNLAAAERDLQDALTLLQDDESRMLAGRKVGDKEELLSGYFSRFQKIYDELIRQYTATAQHAKAFELAERARAIEPLDLLLRQGQNVPEEFLRIARQKVSLPRIQKSLDAGVYLVQYRVLDDNVHVWTIGRDHFQARVLNVGRQTLTRWSRDLYSAAFAGEAQYDKLASSIHAAVVHDVLAQLPARQRLVFIPDGPLHAIPFAALRRDGRFLLETELVETSPSARFYLWSVAQDRDMTRAGAPSILLIGNPGGDLESATREVEEIQPLYERHKALLQQQATEATLLAEAPRHHVVHIAAHAFANAASPSRSYIDLADDDLQANELVTRFKSTQTRLFVLAACSSAGGDRVGPEGVAPLVRPIIAAGVPAVVGSIWSVDDDAARSVMVPFHRYLSQGHDAAQALRLAQLDLLRTGRNPEARSVRSWGSFQVIGHAASPFAAPHPNSIKEQRSQ